MRQAPPGIRNCPRCEGKLDYVKTNSKYLCPTCSTSHNEFSMWSIEYLNGFDDCKNKVYKKPKTTSAASNESKFDGRKLF